MQKSEAIPSFFPYPRSKTILNLGNVHRRALSTHAVRMPNSANARRKLRRRKTNFKLGNLQATRAPQRTAPESTTAPHLILFRKIEPMCHYVSPHRAGANETHLHLPSSILHPLPAPAPLARTLTSPYNLAMRRLFLRDAASGDMVDDVFVLTNKQFAAASTGKYYIKAFVSDASGQLVARMWNTTREIFNWLPDSGFIKVRGRIENYQSNLQFIIESVGPAMDGTFQVEDLVAHTKKNIPEMFAKVRELLAQIRNRHLKALMDAYLADQCLMDNFCKAPAAMSFHHAFLGGLLEHTLNAMQVAEAVMPFYPGLNRDMVIAGIFLHDIAKTWELTYNCAFGYSDSGHLVGHIVKSAIWVEQKAKEAADKIGEPIPQPLIDVMQHIILAHHGTHEFGSPRLPSTPEALAVHALENMDAKLMMSLEATRDQADSAEGNWTEYMKAFSGKLYRPDVAPIDIEDQAPQPPTPTQPAPPPAPTPVQTAAPAPAPQPISTPAPSAPAAPVVKPKPTLSNPLFESMNPKRG